MMLKQDKIIPYILTAALSIAITSLITYTVYVFDQKDVLSNESIEIMKRTSTVDTLYWESYIDTLYINDEQIIAMLEASASKQRILQRSMNSLARKMDKIKRRAQ